MTNRKTVTDDRLLVQVATLVKEFLKRFAFFLFLTLTLGSILLSNLEAAFIVRFRTSVMDALLPFLTTLSRPVNATGNMISFVHDLATLHEENARLKKENSILTQHYYASKRFEAENIQLRKLLNFVTEPAMRHITARVVGDTSGPYIRSAIINAGSKNGIQKGQVVINDQGVVGRIIEVGIQTARILLITDLNSNIPVITQNSRERGIVSGNNSTTPTILYLPEDSKVKTGEMLLTSGDGGLFPAGLPIGTVSSKGENSVLVTPAVTWSRLEFVSILVPIP
jgi:rod shape-determining protein MreC